MLRRLPFIEHRTVYPKRLAGIAYAQDIDGSERNKTMAKMYFKSELTYKSGYILTEDNDVVALPNKVAKQLNEIETMIQKALYLASKPKACPEPTLDGFVRNSERKVYKIKSPATPMLDRRAEDGAKILNEIRNKDKVSVVNDMIEANSELFAFLDSNEFVEGDEVERLDLPTLGNPLDLSVENLSDMLIKIAE